MYLKWLSEKDPYISYANENEGKLIGEESTWQVCCVYLSIFFGEKLPRISQSNVFVYYKEIKKYMAASSIRPMRCYKKSHFVFAGTADRQGYNLYIPCGSQIYTKKI